MKPWLRLFLAGYLARAALASLHQDILGMERYIEVVKSSWISSGITIPLACIFLLLCIPVVLGAIKEIEDRP